MSIDHEGYEGCCICYEETTNQTPCLHKVCIKCLSKIKLCPMCRQNIDNPIVIAMEQEKEKVLQQIKKLEKQLRKLRKETRKLNKEEHQLHIRGGYRYRDDYYDMERTQQTFHLGEILDNMILK